MNGVWSLGVAASPGATCAEAAPEVERCQSEFDVSLSPTGGQLRSEARDGPRPSDRNEKVNPLSGGVPLEVLKVRNRLEVHDREIGRLMSTITIGLDVGDLRWT